MDPDRTAPTDDFCCNWRFIGYLASFETFWNSPFCVLKGPSRIFKLPYVVFIFEQ